MICVAANTATAVMSVAIVDGDKTLYHFTSSETRDQGNLLIDHIGKGLAQNGLTYADIGLLAVATGPGSFTGIRIGLAAMRGIALAGNIPVTGISTFDLFATAGADNIVAIESWRDELYFRVQGHEPVNLKPQEFAKTLQGKSYTVSGDATEKLKSYLPDADYATGDLPDALKLAALALAQKSRYTEAVPVYVRPPDVTLSDKNRKIAGSTEP